MASVAARSVTSAGSTHRAGTALADADAQLAELQGKYKNLEGTRRAYTEDSQVVIRRQRTAIEKLKEDNASLKSQLALETRGDSSTPSASIQQELSRLQDMADAYTRRLDTERRTLEELEKKYSDMTEQALDRRRATGGINAPRENNAAVIKQIRVLENRLDKALVKFNESLAHNKALREQIDSLQRERLVFDQIYKKLEKELHNKKKEMASVIEISNLAYEARDQAQHETAALKAQADKEQVQFEVEWLELGKMIDAANLAAKRAQDSKHSLGSMSMEEESRLRKKVVRGNWGIAKDKAGAQASAEKIAMYEDAFDRIQKVTGINDIDQLVTTFIHNEDQNYALFNYVNELNQEMEKLEEQVAEAEAELEKYKAQGQGANTDQQHKKIITELEAKVVTMDQRAEAYDQKYDSATRLINALRQGIASTFQRIGCSKDASKELLGEGVTETNLMQYLGVIEQRTNELLHLYARHQIAQAGGDSLGMQAGRGLLTEGPTTAAGSGTVTIEPPSTADDYSSEDDSDAEADDRPLSREELHQKTIRTVCVLEGF
eukprot:jgi/Chlat1/3812/Chrsp26S04049